VHAGSIMWGHTLTRFQARAARHMSSSQQQSLSQSGKRFHGKADSAFESSVWTLGAISLILPVGIVLVYDPVPAERNAKKKKAAMFGDEYPSSLSTTGLAVGSDSQCPLPSGRAYLLKSGDRQVCVTQFGSDSGRPVLLFHGLAASRIESAATMSIADPLQSGEAPDLHQLCTQQGLRLLCIDRPGYGLTSPASSAADAPSTSAADAVHVLDALRLPSAQLVAVDMGAVPAVLMAEQHSARVHGEIHLLAPDFCRAVAPSDGLARGLRDWLLQTAPISTPFMHFFAKFLRLTTLAMPANSLKNAQMQNVTADSSDAGMMGRMGGGLMLSCAQASMDRGATGVQHDLTVQLGKHATALAALRQLPSPVHLWQGMQDQVVPSAVPEAMLALLPNSTVHPLEGAGHLSAVASGLMSSLGLGEEAAER